MNNPRALPSVSRWGTPLSIPPKDARPLVRPAYAQLEAGLVVRYTYVRAYVLLSAAEKIDVLGFLAADLRLLAEQMDEAQLAIASEEPKL